MRGSEGKGEGKRKGKGIATWFPPATLKRSEGKLSISFPYR